MQAALYIQTKVLPGNRIEVAASELKEGDVVDVFLVLPEPPQAARRSALDVIAALQGHRLFRTPEEVDRYVQEERDEGEKLMKAHSPLPRWRARGGTCPCGAAPPARP